MRTTTQVPYTGELSLVKKGNKSVIEMWTTWAKHLFPSYSPETHIQIANLCATGKGVVKVWEEFGVKVGRNKDADGAVLLLAMKAIGTCKQGPLTPHGMACYVAMMAATGWRPKPR